jgi:hypothetical protein
MSKHYSPNLKEEIAESLRTKDTDELLQIWKNNDRSIWGLLINSSSLTRGPVYEHYLYTKYSHVLHNVMVSCMGIKGILFLEVLV